MFRRNLILIITTFFLISCSFDAGGDKERTDKDPRKEGEVVASPANDTEVMNSEENGLPEIPDSDAENETGKDGTEQKKDSNPAQNKPRTAKDYFMLLPEKYFSIECCPGGKKEYLDKYLEVDDVKNGYLAAGGDGGQSTFAMALFKRPDKTYLIALNVFGESYDDYYFLDYKNGNWRDISSQVIPEYSKMKIYEIPRFGTTIPVFSKKVVDSDGVNDITEKDKKLYDLVWKNGKFTISR